MAPRKSCVAGLEPRKLVITERVREQLISACDSVYPEEAGGYLFGIIIGDTIRVKEILPIVNKSERPRDSFKFSEESLELAELYAKTKGVKKLGRYHSHPDSSIPSYVDVIGVKELEVWIFHKEDGSHDFLASWYRTHLKLEFESMHLSNIGQAIQLSTGKLHVQQMPTICRILKSMVSGLIKSEVKSILGTEKQKKRYLALMEKEGLIEKKEWNRGSRGFVGTHPDCLYTISEKGLRLLKLHVEYENRLKEFFLEK